MRATFIRCQRMNFVDDNGPGRFQHITAGFRAEQNIERFRRGNDDMRRPAAHLIALGGRGVARADPGSNLDIRQASRLQLLPYPRQRLVKVALYIVGKRLQRRDINDLRLIRQCRRHALPHQSVNRRQESRQCFARPGRSGNERMAARAYGRPCLRLRGSRRAEPAAKPCGDRRVKKFSQLRAGIDMQERVLGGAGAGRSAPERAILSGARENSTYKIRDGAL